MLCASLVLLTSLVVCTTAKNLLFNSGFEESSSSYSPWVVPVPPATGGDIDYWKRAIVSNSFGYKSNHSLCNSVPGYLSLSETVAAAQTFQLGSGLYKLTVKHNLFSSPPNGALVNLAVFRDLNAYATNGYTYIAADQKVVAVVSNDSAVQWGETSFHFTAAFEYEETPFQPAKTAALYVEYTILGPDGRTVCIDDLSLMRVPAAQIPKPAPKSKQLIKNPGFENGRSPWTAPAFEIKSPGISSPKGLYVERTSSNYTLAQDHIATVAGTQHLFQFDYQLPAAGNVSWYGFVYLQCSDDESDSRLPSATVYFTRRGTYSLPFAPRCNSTRLLLTIRGYGAPDVLLLDNFSLRSSA